MVHRAGRGLCLERDDTEQRRFTRAIGPKETMHPARREGQIERAELERGIALSDIAQFQMSRHQRPISPLTPASIIAAVTNRTIDTANIRIVRERAGVVP